MTRLAPQGIFSTNRLGLQLDAGLQWKLWKKVTLYSAVSYQHQDGVIGYSYQSQNVKTVESAQEKLTYVLKPEALSSTLTYSMKNLGISTGLLYQIQEYKSTLQHHLGAGVEYHVGLFTTKTQGYLNSGSSYFNYLVLYRLQFPISTKLNFYIQPGYRGRITSNERLTVPFTIASTQAQIGLGIIYRPENGYRKTLR